MATLLPAYESQLPQLLTSVQNMLGSKTTTSQSSKGNTDALQQIFAQTSAGGKAGTPEMMALIEAIFREGAAKVPELTTQFANSTGSRTAKNSGLNLALGDLNRQLSTTAAQAILQNQQANNQMATQAATGIANSDRTVTTGVAQGAKTNPLLPILAGWGLNKLDKSKLFGGNASAAQANGFPVADDGTTAGINDMISSMNGGGGDIAASGSGMDYTADLAAAASGLESLDSGLSDWMPDTSAVSAADSMDFSGSGMDLGGNLLEDVADFDFGGFDLGFKDGGVIGGVNMNANARREAEAMGTAPAAVSKPAAPAPAQTEAAKSGNLAAQLLNYIKAKQGGGTGMADGGVVRNRNNMGVASRPAPLVNAVNGSPVAGNGAVKPATATGTARPIRRPEDELQIGMSDGEGQTTSATDVTNGMTDASPAALGGLALTALGMFTGLSPVTSVIGRALDLPNMNPLSKAVNAVANMMSPAAPQGMDTPESIDGIEGTMSTVSPQGNPMSTNPSFMASQDPFSNASMGATSAASAASPTAGSDPGEGDAAASGVGSGADAGMGGPGSPGGWKNGGLVTGPGTGTSDSIPVASAQPGGPKIKYSSGEYVIPEDVVRFWGTKRLDSMISAVHRPAGA